MKKLIENLPDTFIGKKGILVLIKDKTYYEIEEEAEELTALSKTLGIKIIEKFYVNLQHINPATYIGKGKLEEIKNFVQKNNVSLLIFEKELSPVQQRNIEEVLNIKVIDRTELILYIFGEHANSKEGKIQVELAQLNYLLPRLTGHGIALSRLGGGLGTRGPGEMKLEVYKRRIKERIYILKEKIKDIEKHRKVIRKSRENFPTASLLGYTNVGKSSLLNALSSANLYVADKLFATLDPATRAVYLDKNKICLVSDTVGLLKNIPHHLIEAFKSTMEEIKYSDLIICVFDISKPTLEKQKETISEVLKILNIENKNKLEVFNKIDLLSREEIEIIKNKYPEVICVSAKTKEGIDNLKNVLKDILYG
ncbi:MAG: GTPase HflX, partial [bacterium]|nr:GTPase HflX [bacterium]MDW8164629.1 GTPase HflX [Candidatus Omnitrophota bacterium]